MKELKIIIIEDKPEWQEELEEAFVNAGHKVIEVFKDAVGVYEAAKLCGPDLMVIDIAFGGSKFAGIELAKQLQQLHLPFVYLTSQQEQLVHIKAYETGNPHPFRYLHKPHFQLNPTHYIEQLIREFMAENPTLMLDDETHIYYSNVCWIYGKKANGTIYCKDGQEYKYENILLKTFMDNQVPLQKKHLHQANRNVLVNPDHVRAWPKIDKQYQLFFNQEKTLPENGITVSFRNQTRLIAHLKNLHNSL